MGAVLNTVYNNYLAAYSPRQLTKYDTHKKSELRSVYNSIVKLNKDAPWYLPTTNKDTQHYAVSLKENARELHNAIAQLGGLEQDSMFRKKSAYSTDTEVAEAAYIGSDTLTSTSPEFDLEVKELATPQENLGYFLPDLATTLSPATYSFDISINDMNYEFQFNINEGDTNRQIMDRLSRLINNADIGIQANVAESDSRYALRLTSDATGVPANKAYHFRVSDDHTSKASGVVGNMGLNYISHPAGNACFLINGEERSSSSNHFTVGKLFDVQIKAVSSEDKPVHIGLKTDTESITDNINQLIGSYNSFIRSAASYLETQSRSRQLVREFSSIASHYGTSLENMGMHLQDDGILSVNDEKLQQAAASVGNDLSSFSVLKDFSSSLLRKSDQVSLNPMDYVDKKIVAYKNPGHNFISPYTTSAYSGMMFNRLLLILSQIKAVAVFVCLYFVFSPWPCTYRSVQNRPSVPGSYHVPSDSASHNSA